MSGEQAEHKLAWIRISRLLPLKKFQSGLIIFGASCGSSPYLHERARAEDAMDHSEHVGEGQGNEALTCRVREYRTSKEAKHGKNQ